MKALQTSCFAWCLATVCACGNVVVPAQDAATDSAVGVDSLRLDADAPVQDATADEPATDVVRDRVEPTSDVADANTDASLVDGAANPPSFADLYAYALDTNPSRSDEFGPFWFVSATVYAEVLDDVVFDVPNGRCRSTTVVDNSRVMLGAGRARVLFREFALEQPLPNWYRTAYSNESVPFETTVELQLDGTPSVAPFRVTSTWPQPTTYFAPLRGPGQEVLVVSVSAPLTIRFAPTEEQVVVRLDGRTRGAGRERVLSHCVFDGRSGLVAVPAAILARYPHDSPPRNGEFAFYSFDTVRAARVNVAGVEAEFRARAVSMTFPLMFSR